MKLLLSTGTSLRLSLPLSLHYTAARPLRDAYILRRRLHQSFDCIAPLNSPLESTAGSYRSNSMASTLRGTLLAILIISSLIVSTAHGAPTLFPLESVSVDQDWAGEADRLSAMSKHDSRELIKRHEYAMVCGFNKQKSSKGSLEGPEDIELSRKCLSPTYRYTCDRRT